MTGVDYAALFAATPTPCLVLTPDLVIREANPAYERATGRQREELIGQGLFDAFPLNPSDPEADGVANVRASLERARDTGLPDTMAVQKYDIPVPGTGTFVERFWSPVNVPVLDADGRTTLLLHRVEDVTDYVRQREGFRGTPARERRLQEAEADLFARARELEALNGRLRELGRREREVALTLQRAMLPGPGRVVAGLDVAARYQPAEDALQVGGDWYDVVQLRSDCVALAVGDVVGKGLTAAAVMGQLRSALKAATFSAEGPAGALDVLDRYAGTLEDALGTTVAQVHVEPRLGTLRYSRAGHLPPLVVDPAGAPRFLLDGGGPPLGVAHDGVRPEARARVPAGATLVLYTDGLVERRERPLDAGLQALADVVARHVGLDVEALADAILRELLGHGRAPDDAALVVARGARRRAA